MITEEEFTTVYNEGYAEGFGSGLMAGAVLGVLGSASAVLLYFMVFR